MQRATCLKPHIFSRRHSTRTICDSSDGTQHRASGCAGAASGTRRDAGRVSVRASSVCSRCSARIPARPTPQPRVTCGAVAAGTVLREGATGAAREHLLDAAALRIPTSTRGKPVAPHPQLSLATTPSSNATATSQSPCLAPQPIMPRTATATFNQDPPSHAPIYMYCKRPLLEGRLSKSQLKRRRAHRNKFLLKGVNL